MLILLHILIALAGIATSTIANVIPTQKIIKVSYALVGLTMATGTFLVVTNDTPLIHACVSGLVYLGVNFFALALARNRLAKQEISR